VSKGHQSEDDELNGIVEGEAQEEGNDDLERKRAARVTCGTMVSLMLLAV
jgi:hypothetical protein